MAVPATAPTIPRLQPACVRRPATRLSPPELGAPRPSAQLSIPTGLAAARPRPRNPEGEWRLGGAQGLLGASPPAEPGRRRAVGPACEHSDRVVALLSLPPLRVRALPGCWAPHRGHPIGLALDEAARAGGDASASPQQRAGRCAGSHWQFPVGTRTGKVARGPSRGRPVVQRLRKGTGEPRPSFKHQKRWVWE